MEKMSFAFCAQTLHQSANQNFKKVEQQRWYGFCLVENFVPFVLLLPCQLTVTLLGSSLLHSTLQWSAIETSKYAVYIALADNIRFNQHVFLVKHSRYKLSKQDYIDFGHVLLATLRFVSDFFGQTAWLRVHKASESSQPNKLGSHSFFSKMSYK